MSKLQELIRELCPDGVEHKPLRDVVESFSGMSGVSNKWKESGNCKFIDYLNVYNNLTVDVSKLQNATVKNLNQNTLQIGDILLTCASEIPQECAISAVIRNNIDDDVFLDDHLFGIRLKPEFSATICPAFVNYYFCSSQFRTQVCKIVRGVTRFYIIPKSFLNLEIPVPPLPVQEEIVRILDHFTDLAAELQAELQARKEQYEYYRNKLLTFDKIGGGTQSVTWMKMSEIGTFIRGKRFVRTDIVSDGVPCIHYGDMYTYYGLYTTQSKGRLRSELASKMRYAQKNDVVIVAAGENKEDIGIGLAWIGDEPAAVHDACFIFRSDLYPQYVSHYLRSDYYHKQIVKYVSEGKICSISAKGLGNTIIPVPSYEEQVRIATLLNNFDALVGDLSEGLPAEIAAVQEQYEYYRNKLLSFPRTKISA